MTRNTQNKIAILLAASMILGVGYWAYNLWRSAEESAFHSCIGSIATGIQKTEAVKNLTPNGTQWKILSPEEVDFLLTQFQPGDCGKYKNPAIDLWGNRIQVALRKPSDRIEIFVWSKSQDGISSTEDDLVIPYGERPPQ